MAEVSGGVDEHEGRDQPQADEEERREAVGTQITSQLQNTPGMNAVHRNTYGGQLQSAYGERDAHHHARISAQEYQERTS
jgi:hypothetical protein